MIPLTPFDRPSHEDPLAGIAAKIRQHSNCRVAWQLFDTAVAVSSAEDARSVLAAMIADGPCHRFLSDSFDPMYDETFAIEMIHPHAVVVVETQDRFESILASGFAGHLGAYDHDRREPTAAEMSRMRAALEVDGPYRAFELGPGADPGCAQCSIYNNHLFSTWFHAVAWDWCFVVSWPDKHRTLVLCLTDTD